MAAVWASAMARPTALANPWPRGPVVTSMPGVSVDSGWPGVLDPTCYYPISFKGLIFVRIHKVLGRLQGQELALKKKPLKLGFPALDGIPEQIL